MLFPTSLKEILCSMCFNDYLGLHLQTLFWLLFSAYEVNRKYFKPTNNKNIWKIQKSKKYNFYNNLCELSALIGNLFVTLWHNTWRTLSHSVEIIFVPRGKYLVKVLIEFVLIFWWIICLLLLMWTFIETTMKLNNNLNDDTKKTFNFSIINKLKKH